MSHFKKLQNFTDIDESNWELIYNIAKDAIGKKNIKNYNSWIVAQNNLIEKYQDDEEHEYMIPFINHIMAAERAYINEPESFQGMPDIELVSYFTMNKYEDYSEEIINAFGNGPDHYIDYFRFFYKYALLDRLENASVIESKIISLCEKYAEDIEKSLELMAVFASIQIVSEKVKKGVAIYDSILEQDELNLMHYFRICETLEYCELYDLEKEYLQKAIETAKIVDDEEILEVFQDSLNYILEIKEHKPHEATGIDMPTINEMLDSSQDYPDLQRTMIDVVLSMHPDLQEIIFYDNEQNNVDKAYDHIIKTATSAMDMFTNDELRKKFKELTKTMGEHEALHTLFEIE